ncbi:MAG: hypothetical protein ASARMPRED_007869 [Alectoria sarmentosa]|nr:MAG: hypothetical protein ASARMPRED_007869 [Alectoria sarmentosa]
MAAQNGNDQVYTFSYATPGEVWAMGVAMPAACALVVGLRFMTRNMQKARIGIDDWLILGGLITFIGIGMCFIIGAATHAFGYPTPPYPADLTTEDEILNYVLPISELVGKLEFAIQLIMMVCYGFVKLSIVAFYRRIFVVNKRTTFDIITRVTGVVIFLWVFTFILIIIFPCGSHIDNNWGTAAQQEAHCLVIGYTSLEGLAASDFIIDVVLLALPIPMIWSLRMTPVKKIAVTGIMMLGAASLAASIARLVLYLQTQQAAIQEIPVDFDESITLIMYWSTIETGLALIAACLPTLSYLFNGVSLQSAVNSVRSALSLGSVRSTRKSTEPSRAEVSNPYIDIEANNSSSSYAKMFPQPEKAVASTNYPLQPIADHDTKYDTKPMQEQSTITTVRNGLEA